MANDNDNNDNDNKEAIDVEYIEIVDEISIDYLSKVKWKTRDGKLILVKDIDDNHLRNSALFLMNFGYTECIAKEPLRIFWLQILRMEWQRRMSQKNYGLSQNKGIRRQTIQ